MSPPVGGDWPWRTARLRCRVEDSQDDTTPVLPRPHWNLADRPRLLSYSPASLRQPRLSAMSALTDRRRRSASKNARASIHRDFAIAFSPRKVFGVVLFA